MLRIRCILVAAALAVVLAPTASAAQDSGEVRDDLGRAMFELVNDEREARGIEPLAWDDELAQSAEEWSGRMARDGRVRHRGLEAEDFDGYAEIAGNVSMNSAGQVGRSHQMFMESDSHRSNLLDPGLRRGAAGIFCGADGSVWVTQYLARGSDDPSPDGDPGVPPSDPFVHDDPEAGGSCAEGGTADGGAGAEPAPDEDGERTACPGGEAPEASFSDRGAVPESHRANVDCAVWHAIVSGFADDTYRPGLSVRRDQMATFLANTLAVAGVELPAPSDDRFDDVTGSRHAEAVHRLAAAGIVAGGPEGMPAGAYGPDLPVRRDQTASLLMRALEYATGEDGSSPRQAFDDVPDDGAHSDNVNGASAAGLVAGADERHYRPAGDVRRDQMATFTVRFLTR